MTVSNTTNKGGPYSGAGTTGPFTVPFYFLSDDDLLVTKTSTSGVDSTLAKTTDYTVTGAGNPSGGSITTVVAVAVGEKITITRNVANTQTTSLPESGPLPSASIETALDKIVMMVQQLYEIIQRAPLLPRSTTVTSVTLPTPVDNYALVWDGVAGTLKNVPASTAISGIVNTTQGIVVGGSDSVINGSGTGQAILGSYQGTISASGAGNVIIGGFRPDIIDASDYSAVVGGTNGLVSSDSAVVLGGDNASVLANSNSSAVIAGESNTITSGSIGSAIIGGNFGQISGAGTSYSVILAGSNNTIGNYYSVAYGQYAKTFFATSIANASNRFSAAGDGQAEMVTVMGSTSNATPTEIRIGGTSGDRLVIPNDTAFMFNIDIVARRTDADNECAAYQLIGCIDNNANTVALVGSVTKNVIAEDTAAWDVSATADNTNKALSITVTGEAAKTIRWVGTVRITRVTG